MPYENGMGESLILDTLEYNYGCIAYAYVPDTLRKGKLR